MLLMSSLMPESQCPLTSKLSIAKANKIVAALKKMNKMIDSYFENGEKIGAINIVKGRVLLRVSKNDSLR